MPKKVIERDLEATERVTGEEQCSIREDRCRSDIIFM